jgi:hypothetical protein
LLFCRSFPRATMAPGGHPPAHTVAHSASLLRSEFCGLHCSPGVAWLLLVFGCRDSRRLDLLHQRGLYLLPSEPFGTRSVSRTCGGSRRSLHDSLPPCPGGHPHAQSRPRAGCAPLLLRCRSP